MATPDPDAGTSVPDAAAWAAFTRQILGTPWGSTSKAELEFQIFQLLVSSGAIDPSTGDGELAARLQVPLARVRALRYRLDQQSIGPNFLQEVLRTFEVHRMEGAVEDVHLVIDSRYVRERFVESLRTERIAVRRELSGELLRVSISDLVWFLGYADGVSFDDFSAIATQLESAWSAKEHAERGSRLGAVEQRLSIAAHTHPLLTRLFSALGSAGAG